MSGPGDIEVIYAEAGRAWRTRLALAPGDTVARALEGLARQCPDWPPGALEPAACAVFGRAVPLGGSLSPGDRLELLRELPTDPKLARRARAAATKTPR